MPTLKNTLVVIADCLRADAVPDEFKQGAIYGQAWSCGSATIPAFASLYTGLLPHQHGQATQAHRAGRWHVPVEGVTMLPDRLPEHNALVVTENYFTSWAGTLVNSRQGGGEGVPYILANKPPEPWLIVYHCMIAHWPYGGKGHEHVHFYKEADPEGLAQMRDLYRGGVNALFAAIAELEDGLQPDASILTADHGEGFLEHGFYAHPCDRLFPEMLHVPLIVRDGKRKHTYRAPFTMALFPQLVMAVAGKGKRVSVTPGELCYSAGFRDYGAVASIRCADTLVIRSGVAGPMRYDLATDPGAQNPGHQLGTIVPELHAPVLGPLVTRVDDEQVVLERLEALGYV